MTIANRDDRIFLFAIDVPRSAIEITEAGRRTGVLGRGGLLSVVFFSVPPI